MRANSVGTFIPKYRAHSETTLFSPLNETHRTALELCDCSTVVAHRQLPGS
jgi:hypothetical protein